MWADDSKLGNTVLNTLARGERMCVIYRVEESCAGGENGDKGGHQSLIPGHELCWVREVNRKGQKWCTQEGGSYQ